MIVNRPQPGYFLIRLVKGGPELGAMIFLPCPWVPPEDPDAPPSSWNTDPSEWGTPYDRGRRLEATIDGKPADIWKVWSWGRPTTQKEYLYRIHGARWDRMNQPSAPLANPTRAVDIRAVDPIF